MPGLVTCTGVFLSSDGRVAGLDTFPAEGRTCAPADGLTVVPVEGRTVVAGVVEGLVDGLCTVVLGFLVVEAPVTGRLTEEDGLLEDLLTEVVGRVCEDVDGLDTEVDGRV